MSDDEITSGGSTIYRYQANEREFRAPENAAMHVQELTDFLEAFLGPCPTVWHEIVSDKVHIDVLPFAPTADRPHWTFVTSGMSDLPMTVPANLQLPDDYRHAELVISLPADWFGDETVTSFEAIDFTEDTWWPIGLLKELARFPHEYGAWVWMDHSFPNGDPARPYATNTRMSGAVLLLPLMWPHDKVQWHRSDGETVLFLAVYPLYGEEMTIKLSKGSDALDELLDRNGITEVLDASRRSVAEKRGFFDFLRK